MMKLNYDKIGSFIGSSTVSPSENFYKYNRITNYSLFNMKDIYRRETQLELLYANKLNEHFAFFEGKEEGLRNFYRRISLTYLKDLGNDINMFWRQAPLNFRAVHTGLPRNISLTMGSLLFSSGIIINLTSIAKLKKEQEAEKEKLNKLKIEWDSMLIEQRLKEASIHASWAGTAFLKWDVDTEVSNLPILNVVNPINARVFERSGIPYRIDFFEELVIDNMSYKLIEIRELIKDKKTNEKKLQIAYYVDKWSAGHALKSHEEYEKSTRDYIAFKKLNHLADNINFELGKKTIKNVNTLLAIVVPNKLPNTFMNSNSYGVSDYEGIESLVDVLDENASHLLQAVRQSGITRYVAERFLPRDKNGIPQPIDEFNKTYVQLRSEGTDKSLDDIIMVDDPDIDVDKYLDVDQKIMTSIVTKVGLTPHTLGMQATGLDGRDLSDRRERLSVRTREEKRRIWEPYLNTLLRQYLILKKLMKKPEGKYDINDEVDYHVTINEQHHPSFEARAEFWTDLWDDGGCDIETMIDKIYYNESIDKRNRLIKNIIKEQRTSVDESVKHDTDRRLYQYATSGQQLEIPEQKLEEVKINNGKEDENKTEKENDESFNEGKGSSKRKGLDKK